MWSTVCCATSIRVLVPTSSPLAALMPAPAHALLLAVIHLAAHHARQVRLIWLYDLHLLASTLNGVLTTSAGSVLRARSIGFGGTTLTIASGFTNNGLLDLTGDAQVVGPGESVTDDRGLEGHHRTAGGEGVDAGDAAQTSSLAIP